MSDPETIILVVDDDEFTAQLTAMILETSGYDCIIADGGSNALEQMAGNPAIRLIVSDMDMPSIDGIQLFSELRKQGYRQPFMVLTGKDAAPLRLAHPELDAVLTKDEQLQDLLPDRVAELLTESGRSQR